MLLGCHKINRKNINTSNYWDNRFVSGNTNNGTSAMESIFEYIKKNNILNSNSKVIDIGSGPNKAGAIINNIKNEFNCDCNIADISKEICESWLNSGVNSFVIKLPNIGLTYNSFDLVICSHVLEHIDEIEESIESIKKILKKDGIAIINSPIGQEWSMEQEHVWWMDNNLNFGIGEIIDQFLGNQYMSMVQVYKKSVI